MPWCAANAERSDHGPGHVREVHAVAEQLPHLALGDVRVVLALSRVPMQVAQLLRAEDLVLQVIMIPALCADRCYGLSPGVPLRTGADFREPFWCVVGLSPSLFAPSQVCTISNVYDVQRARRLTL